MHKQIKQNQKSVIRNHEINRYIKPSKNNNAPTTVEEKLLSTKKKTIIIINNFV